MGPSPSWRQDGYRNSTGALAAGLRHEGVLGARLEHHVGAPPRLIVDQAPFVAGADMVFGEQHIARSDDECLTVAGGEFKGSRQRNDVLRLRIIVPVERGVRRRLLEMDGDYIGAILFVDRAFEHMRRIVGSGVQFECSYHLMLLVRVFSGSRAVIGIGFTARGSSWRDRSDRR